MSDLLKEDRSRGWERVSDAAPAWVKVYITEYRQSRLEKRNMDPTYLQTFRTGCEQRARALGRDVRRILAPLSRKLTLAEVRRLSKSTGRSFEDIVYGYSPKISEDRWLRMRMESITAAVARDAEKLKNEKREELLNRAMTCADGKLALQQYLDEIAGVRPASPGARPYGFQDVRTEDSGQTSDPQQLLRSYPSYADGEDADDEDDHERAVRSHRACAQRCSSVAHGSAHHRAADAHDQAYRNFSPERSLYARSCSYRANHFTTDLVS